MGKRQKKIQFYCINRRSMMPRFKTSPQTFQLTEEYCLKMYACFLSGID